MYNCPLSDVYFLLLSFPLGRCLTTKRLPDGPCTEMGRKVDMRFSEGVVI